MNIASIAWPTHPEVACRYYLGFAIQVMQELGIAFPTTRQDPVAIAKGYVAGSLSPEVCKTEAAAWWAYLESRGALVAPANKDEQLARLALCLLVTSDPLPELGDLVSWLIEVIGLMGYPSQKLIRMMNAYFSPPSVSNAEP